MQWTAFYVWLGFVALDALRSLAVYRRLAPLAARSVRAIVLKGHEATWRQAGETSQFDPNTHRVVPVVRPPLVHGAVVALRGTVVSIEEMPPWELEIRQTREGRLWTEAARTHRQHGFVLQSQEGRFWVPLDEAARVVTGFLVHASPDPSQRTIVSTVRDGDSVRVLGTLDVAPHAELVGFRGPQQADAMNLRTLGGAVVTSASLALDLPVRASPPSYSYGLMVSLSAPLVLRIFFYVVAVASWWTPPPAGERYAWGLCGGAVLLGGIWEASWRNLRFDRDLALWWTQAAQIYPANMEVELDPLWATLGFPPSPPPPEPPREPRHAP